MILQRNLVTCLRAPCRLAGARFVSLAITTPFTATVIPVFIATQRAYRSSERGTSRNGSSGARLSQDGTVAHKRYDASSYFLVSR